MCDPRQIGSDVLTDLEILLLYTLRLAMNYLTGPPIKRQAYQDLMAQIRDVVYKAEAIRQGCSTGRHLTKQRCECPKDREFFKEYKAKILGGGLFK